MNAKHLISEKAKLIAARQGEVRNTLTEELSRPLIERIKTSLKQNKAREVKGDRSTIFRNKCCKTQTSAQQWDSPLAANQHHQSI